MFPNIQGILIAGIASLIIGFGSGWYVGHEKYAEFKSQVQTVAKEEQKEVKQKEEKSNEITKSIVSEYKSTIGSLQHSSRTSGVSSVPKASSGTDDSSPYAALVIECSQTTVQLNELQKWVQEQYLISK